MKEKLLSIGGVFGSVLCVTCCIGPLIIYSLGVGGTTFLVLSRIAPYRPFFLLLTVICLGIAHYRMDKYPIKKSGVMFIWSATIIAILFNFIPFLYNVYQTIVG